MSQIQSLNQDLSSHKVDYALYQAYVDSGKKDRQLFLQFTENVISVLSQTGMALIENAPIIQVKKRIMAASQEFFCLPEEIKNQFIFPNYNERAYVPYGLKKPDDYKNMFLADNAVYQAMRGVDFSQIKDVRNEEGLRKTLEIKNYVPDFNDAVMAFADCGYQMGHAFSEAVAHYFELSTEYANNMKNGNSGVRLLHYMALTEQVLNDNPGITRAKAHADISAFTFLLTSDQPGLQIATKETVNELFGTNFISNSQMGTIPLPYWDEFPTGKDQCVVNVGRQTEDMTNGILPATPHCVRSVPGKEKEERFSAPFFYHFPWDSQMTVWQKAIDLRDGKNYFEQKGPHSLTIEEYVLCDDKRKWIEPVENVPIYRL